MIRIPILFSLACLLSACFEREPVAVTLPEGVAELEVAIYENGSVVKQLTLRGANCERVMKILQSYPVEAYRQSGDHQESHAAKPLSVWASADYRCSWKITAPQAKGGLFILSLSVQDRNALAGICTESP